MDRLLAIANGQPIRPEDWDFIQSVEKTLLAAVLNGLLPENTGFIVSGLQTTLNNGIYTINEGYYFDGQEIVFVPQHHVAQGEDGFLCLTVSSTFLEQRTFYDLTSHDVWELRRGIITFKSVIPSGSVAFDTIPMIDKLASIILIKLNAGLTTIGSLIYLAGFTHTTSFAYGWFGKNNLNCYMIIGSFHASVESGHIFTLPSGNRPTGDIVGFFFNNSSVPGLLTIKKDGRVFVYGASLSDNNYISFQYFNSFVDPVLGSLPVPTGTGNGE